jgi:AcrR family transcriptional regulator
MSAVDTRSIAERKREVVRVELAAAASRLLADRDYDTITIDDIVGTAGVSRRTFFRYFPTKEDVFLAVYGDYGRGLRARLAARPADEAPATALREAFTMETEPDLDKSYQLAKATMRVPAVYARHLEHLALWRKALATELGARAGIDPDADVRPELAAAIALAAFDTAVTRWVESGDPTSILQLLDECLEPIRDVIDQLLVKPRPRRGSATQIVG